MRYIWATTYYYIRFFDKIEVNFWLSLKFDDLVYHSESEQEIKIALTLIEKKIYIVY